MSYVSENRYDPHAIERKWQEIWEREGAWEVPNPGDPGFDPVAPESYVLEMLPYPSGEPHMGHLKNYSMGDVLAHFRRRNGMRVLHPMGYDAFGLPAENHAIRTGEHPARSTNQSIEMPHERNSRRNSAMDASVERAGCSPVLIAWFSAGSPKAS